ncbi:MAG: sugar phosphate isomerase/epimerase [Clostridiales bacterium]|nr:sugar phosphate isomerase/epimerase [Clostridiales bacterium]
MNIGICIRHVHQDMRGQFIRAKDSGFAHVQLVSWEPDLWTAQEAENLTSILQETGMTITAFWCGWEGPKEWNFYQGPETLGLVPPSYRHVRVKNLIDGANFALKLGVDDVVSHMGFIPEAPSDPHYSGLVAALRFVAGHLKKQGQSLLFETGQETPVTLLRCFEDIGTDNLFVNLDPANLVMYDKANPVDAMDTFGSLVRGVHAKDGLYPVNGQQLGLEVKVGAGKVDFPRLIEKLKEQGYDGSLTIEREIKGEQQQKDILAAKEYLQTLL